MSLELEVEEAFGPEGLLSRATDQFVARAGQAQMAQAVAHAIAHSEVLVVEASTGVGKTFSYLVPALLSGERVLLSTATKTLQDQLFGRDLPRLVKALGVPVRTALLKGRSSYLCLHRMMQARQDSSLEDRGSIRALARVEQWAHITKSGDLAELPGLDERSSLIPLITSTRENCLGAQCPSFRSCHVNLARREALAADVVVINHHLFFADLAVRESGMAELLPTVRIAIFDEAHQLNEIGVQFLGTNLTSGQLLDFCRDLMGAGLQFARGLADWQTIAGSCERAARDLRLCAGKAYLGAKLRWTSMSPEGIDSQVWLAALDSMCTSLLEACRALDTVSELAPDFARLSDRANEFARRVQLFASPCASDSVRWLEVGSQLRLVQSPLNIAEAVKTRLLGGNGESGRSWIFTSATLGEDDRLTWFTKPCGLDDAQVLRIGSPFDYSLQAAFYVPQNLPKPGDPSHALKVAELAQEWITQLGGRTMVLTTTLKALRVIGDFLQIALAKAGGIEVLIQGSLPKRVLIERFREGVMPGANGCVLVASASFWEGIDLPGDALQLVIIDKLPFPPPNDPMAEARSRSIEAEGGSPFNEYFLPEAAVALKQGAGRLIRRESDEGVLVVCDTRLSSMGYGKRLIKALPPMRRLQSESELVYRLNSLTKTCTRDCQLP